MHVYCNYNDSYYHDFKYYRSDELPYSHIAEHWASSSYDDSYIQLMNNQKRTTGILEVELGNPASEIACL